MYVFKNAYLSITRRAGRYALIGFIITIIMIACFMSLSIQKSSESLIQSYKDTNPLEVTFTIDRTSFTGGRGGSMEGRPTFETLTLEQLKDYGNSSLVADYYYTRSTSVYAEDITPVNLSNYFNQSDERGGGFSGLTRVNNGDFNLYSYSDYSYAASFLSGANKMVGGNLMEKGNTDLSAVISEDLAEENELSIGDTITISPNESLENPIILTIIGIYSDNSEVSAEDIISAGPNNSTNQIFVNDAVMDLIDSAKATATSNLFSSGVNATYYLKNDSDIAAFEEETREKGLPSMYVLSTNEDTILEKVSPIQNLSNYSFGFLIMVLSVGAIVIAVVNILQVRDRKREIGILRAIGMSKSKVLASFLIEMIMVSSVAIILGIGVGSAFVQNITNHLLSSEIKSYESKAEEQRNNFGPGNFQRPNMNGNFGVTVGPNTGTPSFVETLDIQLSTETFAYLSLIGIAITLFSGLISVSFINKYDPNKILRSVG